MNPRTALLVVETCTAFPCLQKSVWTRELLVSKTGTFTCNFCVSNHIPLHAYKVRVARNCPAEIVLVHKYFSFIKLKEWSLFLDVFRMLANSSVLVLGIFVTKRCQNALVNSSLSFSVPVCPGVTVLEQLNGL
jgi:hypothetical protein